MSVDQFKLLLTSFISTILLSACQLNSFPNTTQNNESNSQAILASNTINYGQYYLALKNLSETELITEIKQQKFKKSQGSIEAEINLLLLYSLPNSPIHNAYTAKSQLNQQLKQHANYQFSPADQAFITLLKDQLNQQLYLFQQVINQELEHDNQAAIHLVTQKKQKNKVAELELKVAQLSEQITQLKRIEQAINDHGQ